MLEWAEQQSKLFCGNRRSMFVGLRPDGGVRRVYFAPSGETFEGQRKTALAESHQAWFLYNPSAETGTGYVEWFNLDKAVAERWLVRKVEADDLADVRGTSPRKEWPSSWRVLIG